MRSRAGLVLAIGLVGCSRRPEPPPVAEGARRHAMLLVVDTLRADVVAEVQTPHIDALAASGSAPRRAWAPGTWTVPSVMSLMTGASVRQHGWDHPMPGRSDPYPPMPDLPTLPERLHALGFETEGYYANPILRPSLGFGRGFDTWESVKEGDIVARVSRAVARWDDDERHLLYVHLYGPHQPLTPSKAARERWGLSRKRYPLRSLDTKDLAAVAAYRSAYGAVVEDTDARIGRILDALGAHRQDTVIVLTADHGELIGEHDHAGHGRWVNEPLTHVPFIAEGAGPLPDLLSAAAAADVLTRGLGLPMDWPVTIDSPYPLTSQREGAVALSPDGQLKGIWHPDSGNVLQAYDLLADPGEQSPLPAAQAAPLEALRAAWTQDIPAAAAGTGAVDLKVEMSEALQELGYIEE